MNEAKKEAAVWLASRASAQWSSKEKDAANDAAQVIIAALELSDADPNAVELVRAIWGEW